MTNRVRADHSELDALDRDIAVAPVKTAAAVVASTTKAAVNIRDQARANITGHPHLPTYPRSITYTLTLGGGILHGSVTAEVGPDKDLPQGPLGNIIEYGTARTGPIPHLGPAYDHELPVWLRFMGDAAEAAL